MFEKSDNRVKLEEKIANAHADAKREAFLWCLRHPFKGIPTIISVFRNQDDGVDEDVIREWLFSLPSSHRYHGAYDELEELEREEGFPAMNYYAEQLDKLKNFLPEENQVNGYYPFAGTDFYWGRIFDRTLFEDNGYEQEFVKNMWWFPEKYQRESIEKILMTMKEAGVFENGASVEYICGDANKTREDNDFNSHDWTLIIKGGHSVMDFLKERFSEDTIEFGAIIAVSPADSDKSLREGMEQNEYTLVHYDEGEQFFSPYAMGLSRKYVFVKE